MYFTKFILLQLAILTINEMACETKTADFLLTNYTGHLANVENPKLNATSLLYYIEEKLSELKEEYTNESFHDLHKSTDARNPQDSPNNIFGDNSNWKDNGLNILYWRRDAHNGINDVTSFKDLEANNTEAPRMPRKSRQKRAWNLVDDLIYSVRQLVDTIGLGDNMPCNCGKNNGTNF